MVIEDETEFCGEELLHSMLKCKVRWAGPGGQPVGEGKALFLGFCFTLFYFFCGNVVFKFFLEMGMYIWYVLLMSKVVFFW